MQKTQINNINQVEDIEIDYKTCCIPLIKKTGLSRSIETIKKTQKYIKLSKQKGSNIASKNKSFTQLKPPIKLIIKSQSPQYSQEYSPSKQANISPLINVRKTQQNLYKKATLTQRCLEYKNKKIQQHNQQQNEDIISGFKTFSKQEQLFSTRRHTARTLKNSQEFNQQKCIQSFFKNISIQQSQLKTFLMNKQSLTQFEQKNQKNIKDKLVKKTLQQVFQQTQGRRIETLQSQLSQDDQQYSIVQSIVLPRGQF